MIGYNIKELKKEIADLNIAILKDEIKKYYLFNDIYKGSLYNENVYKRIMGVNK